MSGEELGHGEGRGEELLLLGVLAVVLLKVGPQLLDALSPEASFFPTMSASSVESFMGLVSPDPFPDMVEVFGFPVSVWID